MNLIEDVLFQDSEMGFRSAKCNPLTTSDSVLPFVTSLSHFDDVTCCDDTATVSTRHPLLLHDATTRPPLVDVRACLLVSTLIASLSLLYTLALFLCVSRLQGIVDIGLVYIYIVMLYLVVLFLV